MTGRAMTAAEVADHLHYLTRVGEPATRLVFRLARDAADGGAPFPQPINPRLDPRLWRWARVQVEAYGAGEWSTETTPPTPLRAAS